MASQNPKRTSKKSTKKSTSSAAQTQPIAAPPTGLLARIFAAIGRGFRNAWNTWMRIDIQVKRDALAFILVGLAVLVALREWFQISGTAGT